MENSTKEPHSHCKGCSKIGACANSVAPEALAKLRTRRAEPTKTKHFECHSIFADIAVRPELSNKEVRRIHGEAGIRY